MAAPQFLGAVETGVNQGDAAVSIDAPSGVSAGDYQLVVVSLVTDSSDFGDTPAGWTRLTNTITFLDSGEDFRTAVYESTTETGPFTMTNTGSRVWHALRMAWTLPDGSAGRTVPLATNQTGPGTSHPVPSVTTTAPDSVIVGVGTTETIDDPLTWASTGGMTEIARQDAINTVERLWMVAAQTERATPGSGSPGTFTTDVPWEAQMFAVVIDGSGSAGPVAPTVDAGPDVQVQVGQTANLVGTIVDDGGDTVTDFGWEIIAGPAEVGMSWALTELDYTPAVAGEYTLEFHATNSAGTGTDTLTLTATEPVPSQAQVIARATGESADETTSHVINLPEGIAAGDQVLVAFTQNHAVETASTASPGWVDGEGGAQWTIWNGSSTNLRTTLFYCPNSESGGSPLTITTSAGQRATWVVWHIRSGGDLVVAADEGGNNTQAEFLPIIDLEDGDYLHVMVVGVDVNTSGFSPALQNPPSGYTVTSAVPTVSNSAATFGMDAPLSGTSASPGPVTYSPDATEEQWTSFNVIVMPGTGGGDPPEGDVPGDVYDLSRWKLTLPTEDPDDPGEADEVEQPELDTYEDEHFFLDDTTGRMVMIAPVQGFTTSGASGATRCEFREMELDGSLAAWSPFHPEPRQLTVTMRVDPTSITDRQEVIIGQIHGAGSSPIPLILSAEWDTSAEEGPRVRIFHDGPSVDTSLLTGLTTTTDFTYRIRYDPHPDDPSNGGTVSVLAAIGGRENLPSTPHPDHVFSASEFDDQVGWYFKAGAYNKSAIEDGGTGEARVEISYFGLDDFDDGGPGTTTHRFYLTNTPTPIFRDAGHPTVWDDASNLANQYHFALAPAGPSDTAEAVDSTTTVDWDNALARWVSDPATADGRLTGEFALTIAGAVSDTQADMHLLIVFFVVTPDDQVRGTAIANLSGLAWDTTGTARVTQAAYPAEVDFFAGDRLVLDLGVEWHNNLATPYSFTAWFGGTGGDLQPGDTGSAITTRSAWMDVETTAGVTFEAPTEFDATGTAGLALDGAASGAKAADMSGVRGLALGADAATERVADPDGAAPLMLGASATTERAATPDGATGLALGATGAAERAADGTGSRGLALGASGHTSGRSADAHGSVGLTLGASGQASAEGGPAEAVGTVGLQLGASATVAARAANATGAIALGLGASGHTAARQAATTGTAGLALGANPESIGIPTGERAGVARLALGADGHTSGRAASAHGSVELSLGADPGSGKTADRSGAIALGLGADPDLARRAERAGEAGLALGADAATERAAARRGTAGLAMGSSATTDRLATPRATAGLAVGAAAETARTTTTTGRAGLALGVESDHTSVGGSASAAGSAGLALGVRGRVSREVSAHGLVGLFLSGGESPPGELCVAEGEPTVDIYAS